MKIGNLIFLLLFSLIIKGEIKVGSVLGDNMVLQRNSEMKLWGKANPNQKLFIVTSWNKRLTKTTSNNKGEWIVKIKTEEAGGPYKISITSSKEKVLLKNILLGEVWLCSGQSNMGMPIRGIKDQPVVGMNDVLVDAVNDNIRLFTLKKASMATPQDTCGGNWEIADGKSVAKFSAVGYFFAKQLQQKLKVPVGIICSSWGGSRIEAWMKKEVISTYVDPYTQTTKENTPPHHKAAYLYNGMISPIVNFTIKGVIWYQGESNIINYKDYSALLNGMVENWRNDFGVGQFPFYFVQIAPYRYEGSNLISSAMLRDEQLKASLLIPNSGLISTIDIGEENSIHPSEKLIVSKRLSYWALKETYDIKGISYKNPTFKNIVSEDSTLLLTFDNIGTGLTAFGKEINNFFVAGEDKVFYSAKALISNNKVQVYSPQVKKPVAVRYCFCNFPQGKGFIYNTAGLPILPFRYDDWDN